MSIGQIDTISGVGQRLERRRKQSKINEKSVMLSCLPADKTLTRSSSFLNGLSSAMNVNGSITPQIFTVAPGPNRVYIVDFVNITLIDPGPMLPENFGAIPGLLNGVELSYIEDGTEINIIRCRRNLDIVQHFLGGVVGNKTSQGSNSGLFSTADYVTGRFDFFTPLILDGNKNESLIYRIQDDLTEVQNYEAACRYREIMTE